MDEIYPCYKMNYGPSATQSGEVPKSLLYFMRECEDYVAKLTLFKKYCIWRYTIGSASVNTYLITNTMSSNAIYWAYLFFKYWSNTAKYPVKNIPSKYKGFLPYFVNPDAFNRLGQDQQEGVAGLLIKTYAITLQQIILAAPKVKLDGFHVYKISSRYPGLPESVTELPAAVEQFPFNSTTVTQYFNFAIFAKAESTCCLFDIYVPPGSVCLSVPSFYHAYPWEREVILPIGSIFEVRQIVNGMMNYIEPTTLNSQMIQPKGDISMGNVFLINEYSPCKGGQCVVQKKPMTIYQTVLA